MKKIIGILTILLSISVEIIAQEYDSLDIKFNSYLMYNQDGEVVDGKKIGKWIDRGLNGIMYRERYYGTDETPVGTWKIYYPSGRIRKETQYNDGKVVRWSKFIDDYKILEIECEAGLEDSTYIELTFLEDIVFASEGNFKLRDTKSFLYDYKMNEDIYEIMDTPEAIPHYLQILQRDASETKLTFWYPYVKLCREYSIANGKMHKKAYEYRKDLLISVKEYFNHELVMKTTYDKKGNVKRIKEYSD